MKDCVEYLYRIISFQHLVDLFETNKLFFARPSSWEDPYEKRLMHPKINEVFGQCWSRRGVSDAMWKIYSPNHFGVRIKVGRSKLLEQLNSAKKESFQYRKIGKVKYCSAVVIDREYAGIVAGLESTPPVGRALDSLMFKRNAYSYEAETRVLISSNKVGLEEKGIFLPVSPHDLIESILADPRMPEAVFASFKFYLKEKLKYEGLVSRSRIYDAIEPLSVQRSDEV